LTVFVVVILGYDVCETATSALKLLQ